MTVLSRMGEFWQNPYVNIFKHYGVGQWKKCSKEGDVASLMDRVVKCPIYKISGTVPANNFIVIPKHSSQSAGLTGSHLCILFKPIPGQFFTIHLEVISTCGVLIRISISNIYKQFKASATWLQFPYIVREGSQQWSVVMFNFPHLLRKYVNREYSHIKSIKLCANMFVKNVFSTSKSYNPLVIDKKIKVLDEITKPGDEPFPREMRYPVPSGHEWREFYEFIKFPPTSENLSVSVPNSRTATPVNPTFVSSKNGERVFKELPVVKNKASNVSISKRPKSKKASEKIDEDFHNMSLIENVTISPSKRSRKLKKDKMPPICCLKKVLGLGPCKKFEFSSDTEHFYYASGSILVMQSIESGAQKLFTGHSDSIMAFTVDQADEFMTSSQKDSPLIRIWAVSSQECIALVKSAEEACSILNFSLSDKVLLGITSARPRSKLILWDTSLLKLKGDMSIICEGSCSDALIQAQLSPVNSSKIATCSSRSLQIWRLRAGKLKSCSISQFFGLEYVLRDLKWGPTGCDAENFVYLATAAGIIIEVDSTKASTLRCIDLCAVEGPGVKAINSIDIHSAFGVTSTDDGNLKIWDSQFSEVILNVEHESAVKHCLISASGLKLLAATETDSVGVLDATTKSYLTVLRSHSKKVTAVAVDPCQRQLASISHDSSLRVWNLDSLTQTYEVFSAGEVPTTLAYHPYKGSIVAGYSKGTVRVIENGDVTEEHLDLTSSITSTTFLPNGEYLYVSDALGTLVMYHATKSQLIQLKSIKHIVAKGGHRSPAAVHASKDSRMIGFAGPTEHCVTVLEASTLTCLIKLDVSSAVSSCLDSVQSVVFGTVVSRDLFVSTMSGKVLRVDTKSGVIVSDHQPYPSSTPHLLISDSHIITANQGKFNVCDYANMSTLQKYVAYGGINHMTFTPSLTELIVCGDSISIWSFAGRNAGLNVKKTENMTLTKRVSFDQESGMVETENGILESGVMSTLVEEDKPHTPVLMAPTPDLLQPVQSDIRLEETLDNSDDKTLDLSSIPLNPSPPPAPHPPVETVKVVEKDESDKESNSDLENVSNLSDDNSEELPKALAPANGQHPFQLSPESASPISPEPSPEPPLALRHITLDNPKSSLSDKRYMASADSCGLELATMLGNETEARSNVIWRGSTLFYTLGNVLIAEDLKTSKQVHLIQHTETITSLAHTADRLASCSAAHKLQPSQICVWNADTLELLQTCTYHEHQIQCIEFTVDGSYLISVGNFKENALVLWDMSNYAVHTVAKTENYVLAVGCDPQNATEFVTVGKCVQFWILDHKQELSVAIGSLPIQFIRSVGDEAEFTAVTYTDTGMVYIGTSTGYVTLWDPRSTACILHWSAHPQEIDMLWYQNSSLLSGGVSKNLKLWNIQNTDSDDTTVMLHDELEFDAAIVSCFMDEQMNLGIVGTTSGTLWYVNWEDKTSIRLVGGHPAPVNDIAFSSGDTFAVAIQDGSLRLWNYEPLEQAVQFQVVSTSCTCAVFRPGDSTRVSAGYGDGTIRTFDLASVSMICKMAPHRQAITILRYSQNGQVLVSGDNNGLASVINSETGLIMRVISDHKKSNAAVTSLNFSSLSPHWLLATADRRVSVWAADWETDNNKMIAWLSFPAPSFTPSGEPLDRHNYKSLPPSLAQFSPLERDTILYTGYGLLQEILFYNFKSKETVRKIDLAHWATALDIIPNSNLIVVGSHDRLVTIIDYTSGTFQDYVAHGDEVGVARYWEKNNVLCSGSGSAIALWNVKV